MKIRARVPGRRVVAGDDDAVRSVEKMPGDPLFEMLFELTTTVAEPMLAATDTP